MNGLIGYKLGMTRIFTQDGISIPITVIKIKKNYIVQIKINKNKNFFSVQLTSGEKKTKLIKKSIMGHLLKSGIKTGAILHEFYTKEKKNLCLGQKITLKIFNDIKKVDITGISKGKGFAGTIKRWNFASQDATHGNSLSHRVPGSIGQNQSPGKVFKGKKMPGQMGNKKVTIKNLDLIKMDLKKNLIFVKGAVPGASGKIIIIKKAIKF